MHLFDMKYNMPVLSLQPFLPFCFVLFCFFLNNQQTFTHYPPSANPSLPTRMYCFHSTITIPFYKYQQKNILKNPILM